MSKQQHSDNLMRALEYQPGDLDANREGKLGAWQRARIERLRQQYLIGGAIFAGVLLVMSHFVAWFFGVFVVIIVAGVGWTVTQLSLDLSEGRVESVSGLITRDRSSSGGGYSPITGRYSSSRTRYAIRVGDTRFSVPGKSYSAFRDAEHVRYAVYYLRRTKTIVGAERID